jgi:uncharacterized membrane protein
MICIPKKPLPPHTTSFFFAACAVVEAIVVLYYVMGGLRTIRKLFGRSEVMGSSEC